MALVFDCEPVTARSEAPNVDAIRENRIQSRLSMSP
jgi:hypothetical protein